MKISETIGFAILGPGIIADSHRKAIDANADLGARLVAVGHYNPDRCAEISSRFGVPCLAQEELLTHPAIDVVCICTPSGQHPAQTIAAAQAGKHVLVEKPMALDLADADAMISTCARAGVKLGVIFPRRANPVFQRIYNVIQTGGLGNLALGVVTIPYYRPQSYYDQADWRGTWALDGGGVLMNQGIHLVDVLVWYMGDPVQVKAYADTLCRDIEVEDTLAATLRFANGALATITATTSAAPGFPARIDIYGTRGCIQLDGESIVRWGVADTAKATVERPEIGIPTSTGAGSDPKGIAPTGHIAIFRDFIEALRVDRPPLVDGAEGRRSLSAVLAIYQATGLLSQEDLVWHQGKADK